MCSGLVEGKSGRRPNLAPMAAWPAAAAPVCLMRRRRRCLGLFSGVRTAVQRLLSALHFSNGRAASLRQAAEAPLRQAAAGGGSSPAGERRARERGRGSGGRRGSRDVLHAVRVRGLGQPLYGLIRSN
jgi:hypothetical protein